MKKITEQQLIQSARRLRTIVREADDDAPSATAGPKDDKPINYDTLGNYVGGATGTFAVSAIAMRRYWPAAAAFIEKLAQRNIWGKALKYVALPTLGWLVGSGYGKGAGVDVDDWNQTIKDVDHSLGISGIPFKPDWIAPELNLAKYQGKSAQKSTSSGVWVVLDSAGLKGKIPTPTVDRLLDLNIRIRDSAQSVALSEQLLLQMAQGKTTAQTPNGGWKITIADHVNALSKGNPTLRDRLYDDYVKEHPEDTTTATKKATFKPEYKPAAQPNGQQNDVATPAPVVQGFPGRQ